MLTDFHFDTDNFIGYYSIGPQPMFLDKGLEQSSVRRESAELAQFVNDSGGKFCRVNSALTYFNASSDMAMYRHVHKDQFDGDFLHE